MAFFSPKAMTTARIFMKGKNLSMKMNVSARLEGSGEVRMCEVK